jgi:triosephosphate isomerase
MKLPIIAINFKSYSEATGKNALKLSKICEDTAKKYKVNISVAPQSTDLQQVAESVRIGVFAQHIDPVDAGQYTGHTTAYAVRETGAIGTLINHSEKSLHLNEVRKCVGLAKKYRLFSLCFASLPKEAEQIADFNPDFIAIEPPELIASGISVSTAKPEVVAQTVKIIKEANPKIRVLCGAGITNGEDVEKAVELGTVGVVVSSAVTKAKNPKRVLTEFCRAIK